MIFSKGGELENIGKTEKPNSEIPIITQILNISNLRTTSVNFITLHILKRIFYYYLKNGVVKSLFTVTVFRILVFEVRLVLGYAERVLGRERVKYSVKNESKIGFSRKLFEKKLL